MLDQFRQSGSLKCLFPRLPHQGMEAVLINTAGGVTGGDRFSLTAAAKPDTHLTLTTQACERVYRAQSGQVGTMRSHLRVGPRAQLDWLPQETLLFQGCALDRRLTIDLASEARLLMVEPLVFGRTAMGEVVTQGELTDRIDIRREGGALYLDALRLTGNIAAHMARPFTGNGAGALASVVYVAPNAEAQLDPVRALLPATGGASLIRPDLLVLRLLAEDSFALRQSL
ncbi:MAG: urease accessory protein UreD, partial [Rhodobacteraceae bacterium]|nr:urease accessory protein UreD [Paracoccaceae bacterium]